MDGNGGGFHVDKGDSKAGMEVEGESMGRKKKLHVNAKRKKKLYV